jgi:hypothetical protein
MHVVVERLDGDFLDSQDGQVPLRPLSSEGNLYRGRNDANLRWEGADPAAYGLDANGQNGYEKYNNSAENFWGDLIGLTDAVSNTPDDRFVEHVRAHVDEDNWAGYFALHMLVGNREGGLYRDTGDDYFIYFPPPGDPQEPPHPNYGTAQLPDDRRVGAQQAGGLGHRHRLQGPTRPSGARPCPPPSASCGTTPSRRFCQGNRGLRPHGPLLGAGHERGHRLDARGGLRAGGGQCRQPPDPRSVQGVDHRPHRLRANETRDSLTLEGGPASCTRGSPPTGSWASSSRRARTM